MVTTSPENLMGTPGEPSSSDLAKSKDYKCLEECYALALRSAADYVVELDPPATREFQRHVRSLEQRVSAGPAPEDLPSLQASFRGELREYRDKSRVYLQRLRDDLNGATQIMQTVASSLISNGEGVQQRVRLEMTRLQKAADSGDLERIRKSVETTVQEVTRSYEELNKANALVTAELQHEIRLLHHEMEVERRVVWTDASSGAWIKKKLDDRLEELMRTSEAFCVIVILITNLKRLRVQCTASLVDQALRALVKRFYGILGEGSLIARLSGDQFAAVVEVDSATAQIMARQVGERLSSRYSVQNDGIAQNIDLRVLCGLVEHARESDTAEFQRKLQQMTGLVDTADVATTDQMP
jgi:GGDEF domain-containing protein